MRHTSQLQINKRSPNAHALTIYGRRRRCLNVVLFLNQLLILEPSHVQSRFRTIDRTTSQLAGLDLENSLEFGGFSEKVGSKYGVFTV